MARVIRDRGASGHDSILFRQDLDYPRVPGAISYYPPEPSKELQKQVRKDKVAGFLFYSIGFILTFIGMIIALEDSSDLQIYEYLIPLILIVGMISAIAFLIINNVALASLSRSLPLILMIILTIFYITTIIRAVMNIIEYSDTGDITSILSAVDRFINTLLNPAFFFMSVGLMICRAGGTMLWTSTKVVHQYIPGMIIIETPDARAPSQTATVASVGTEESPEEMPEEEYVDAKPDTSKPCQNCSQPMTFIEQYGRYYCYDCGTYGEKDEPSE